MKRILYIHHGGAIGGAPLSLLYLIENLDRERFKPVVLISLDGPAADLFRNADIETHVAPDFTDFSHTELVWYGGALLWQLPGKVTRFWPSIRATRRHLRQLKPDLVHVNSSTLAAPARAAWREGIPVVWHIREPLARGYVGLRRFWLRRHIDHDADRIIAISKNDAARLIPSDRIRIIYNFVDFEKFDRSINPTTAREHMNLTPSQHVVTMLGGCSSPKGTLPFVRALSRVRQALPNVRFLIVGPKPRIGASDPIRAIGARIFQADAYDRAVMRTASDAIGKGHVRFTGVRQDIPQVLAASDLVVFPSVVPHFARPIVEAAAMAKPVVASNLGGPRELVDDGVTGLLVSPNDVEKLANAIISILNDAQRANSMGAAGFKRARKLFDAQKNAAQTFAVYDELLGDQKATSAAAEDT